MAILNQLVFNELSKSEILSLKNKNCPRCGHDLLHRIKRKNRHKLLSVILLGTTNLKRYNCEKCEWKGLKTW